MNSSINNVAQNYGRTFDTRFNRQMPGFNDRLYEQPQQKTELVRKSFTWLVLKITGFMAVSAILFYICANMYGDYISKAGHTDDTSIKEIVIGNDLISVPANLIRYNNQRKASNINRLDLYAHWPTLDGYGPQLASEFDSMKDNSPIIFMSLEKREMSTEMSGRVDKIYSHFFSGPPVAASNGLVRRPFKKDSAYFLEDLYYEIDSPYPYAARCIRRSDAVAAPFCMRDIHIGHNLTLTYRFHLDLLPQWDTIERAIKNRFGEMIAD